MSGPGPIFARLNKHLISDSSHAIACHNSLLSFPAAVHSVRPSRRTMEEVICSWTGSASRSGRQARGRAKVSTADANHTRAAPTLGRDWRWRGCSFPRHAAALPSFEEGDMPSVPEKHDCLSLCSDRCGRQGGRQASDRTPYQIALAGDPPSRSCAFLERSSEQ